jgi:thiamine-monophosphate kinase
LKTLAQLGEKLVVDILKSEVSATKDLIDGLGHDAGFAKIEIGTEEVLLVNTDRSGENLAIKLGLAGSEAVGDLAVFHAVSDVIASGGVPKLLSLSLLLPSDVTIDYAKGIMKGIDDAANELGITIVSGDTKRNSSVALVITVIGVVPIDNRLLRSGARAGDLVVVTGSIGTMFAASVALQSDAEIPETLKPLFVNSIVSQRPPVAFGLAVADAKIASACTDISDGIVGALKDICLSSECGAIIDLEKVPIDKRVQNFAQAQLSLERNSLISANGDWQFMYALHPDTLEMAEAIAAKAGSKISVIGKFTSSNGLSAKDSDGNLRHLNLIENDGFSNPNGLSFFEYLKSNPPLLGNLIGD